ncbi:hypothetical protein [Roseivirga pacifica]|uniref:hypothetical protein n=1 Tax=Roseivirga pacifica TaxID=1267423 RepID=UPI002095F775|nr:hypothetical protein [Roseivirga pacifica]MCO6359367.1 hypothetical protein [Roseivirga pacifica]MCO6366737.1 hypothetical protein [Roseivirga pacifica]MCO6370731.1 hypothetical protein [Roseivirga pacifica]MCO6374393.1 hypothetical protein [Roseivirga pacifica]MCO6379652.1 hypothetical protein [Roseivirga pacifica]
MKHTLINTMAILAIACLVSCSENQNTETTTKSYKAVVADSVVFNYLPEVQLKDYDEESEQLLLKDRSSQKIIILNKSGRIEAEFNPFVEGPNYVGPWDFGWIFFGEDSLICYGQTHIYLLTREGEIINKMPFPVEIESQWLLDFDPRTLFNYSDKEKEKFVAMISGPLGPKPRTQAFQDSVNMVYSIDLNTGQGNAIMPKLPESTYRSAGEYLGRGWPYMVNYSGSKFAQMYELDPSVYFWNADKNELINSIKIPETYWPEYKGVAFEEKGKPEILRHNVNIFSAGKFIIVQNLGRIPDELDKQIKQLDNWQESEEYKSAIRKYLKSVYLLFDENQYLGELDITEITPISWLKLDTKEDFFWVQRTYNDERDYRTFLKVKIVEE